MWWKLGKLQNYKNMIGIDLQALISIFQPMMNNENPKVTINEESDPPKDTKSTDKPN